MWRSRFVNTVRRVATQQTDLHLGKTMRRQRGVSVAFFVFAGLQALTLWVVSAEAPVSALYVVVAAVVAAAYVTVGWMLLRAAPPLWPAVILSLLALVVFPVGTLIGAYGLWVLWRIRPERGKPVHGQLMQHRRT